jgi:hypothetical protein
MFFVAVLLLIYKRQKEDKDEPLISQKACAEVIASNSRVDQAEAKAQKAQQAAHKVEQSMAKSVHRRNQLKAMSDYLKKQKQQSGEGEKWEPRYFVKQGGELLFYKTDQRKSLKGTINLREVKRHVSRTPNTEHDESRPRVMPSPYSFLAPVHTCAPDDPCAGRARQNYPPDEQWHT